jgi:hypothetical protein
MANAITRLPPLSETGGLKGELDLPGCCWAGNSWLKEFLEVRTMNKYINTLTLIALVVFGFSACDSRDISSPDPVKAAKLPPSAGEIHNEICAEFEFSHSLPIRGTHESREQILLDFLAASNTVFSGYNIRESVSGCEVDVVFCELYELFELGLLEKGGTPDAPVASIPDFKALHSWFAQNGYLGASEESWLNGLWGMLAGITDPDDVESTVFEYTSLNGMPAPDSPLADYLSVFLHSNVFWGDGFDELSDESEWNIALIGYDAIGTFFGGIWGGALMSTVWVIITDEGADS